MRSTLVAAALAFAALIAGPAPAFADADPRPSPKLQSPADQLPRPTDESLRTAMTALRDTVDARLRADAAQPMGDADYLALAAEIDRQLAAITAGRDFHSRAGRHLQWTLGDIGDGGNLELLRPRVRSPGLGGAQALSESSRRAAR